MMADNDLGPVISNLLSYTIELGVLDFYTLVEMARLVHLTFL